MSTDEIDESNPSEGASELTPLGKRLEILRIERGVSKQRLARHAGTSRQQLWRVMTGKSELTSSLRERLATALAVDASALTGRSTPLAPAALSSIAAMELGGVDSGASENSGIVEYLTDPLQLVRTLRTLPVGDSGRRLKRSLLNALEELAVDSGFVLPLDYSDIRRRVLAGEL